MVSGCLYSIGVGPGDPELMTLKAVHTISKCPVLGFAGRRAAKSAWLIRSQDRFCRK